MAAKRIDGKVISAYIKERAAKEAAQVALTLGRKPCLAVIIVGENPASKVYVNNKKRPARHAVSRRWNTPCRS